VDYPTSRFIVSLLVDEKCFIERGMDRRSILKKTSPHEFRAGELSEKRGFKKVGHCVFNACSALRGLVVLVGI